MIRTILLLAPVALLVACTPERGPIGHMSFPGEHGTEYKITPDGIADARVSIARVDNGKTFRGFISGSNEEVEARVEAGALKGTRGSMPINMTVEQKGPEIVANGYYGGKKMAVHIIHGPQGSCAFRYDERDSAAEVSTCGSQRSYPIPDFMSTWPKEEQALFMTVAFAEIFNGPTGIPNLGPGGWGVSASAGHH